MDYIRPLVDGHQNIAIARLVDFALLNTGIDDWGAD